MQPRDPTAFRAKVMRRAAQIERRRRAARALVVAPTIVSIVLGVALIQQLQDGSGNEIKTAQAGEGAPLHADPVDIGAGTPWSVATRPDGSAWVLVRGADGFKVVTADERGRHDVAALPADAKPDAVVSDLQGGAWMTDPADRRILHVDSAGRIASFATAARPSASGTLGIDGRFWFAQSSTDELVASDVRGHQQSVALPKGTEPARIAAAPGGSIAYGAGGTNVLGTVTPAGDVTEYHLDQRRGRVTALGTGPGSSLWFVSESPDGARLGRLTAQATLRDELLPAGPVPPAITLGTDGRLWFSTARSKVVHQRSLTRFVDRHLDRPLRADSWAVRPNGTVWAVDRGAGVLLEVFSD